MLHPSPPRERREILLFDVSRRSRGGLEDPRRLETVGFAEGAL